MTKPLIAVIIPCYNVKTYILDVIKAIDNEVDHIFVVDDCCPEKSGDYVKENCFDSRVTVLYNEINLGVGGAVIHGYKEIVKQKIDIAIKIDGDGQMDPKLIPLFIRPILEQKADYTKGNRFWSTDGLKEMPKVRLFGNSVLSFFSKVSSGYWQIFDPTNGFTAIHRTLLESMPLDKISKRYFFESDILFRLGLDRAVVLDIPMSAVYGDEESGLKISKIILPFLRGHIRNLSKRVFYNYFIRDFSVASVELILGIILSVFGFFYGAYSWISAVLAEETATSGTVMLAALPLFMGFQLLLSALNYDIQNAPKVPRIQFLKYDP